MTDSSDVLMELLTLTLTVDQWGNRIYRNSLDELHRQHAQHSNVLMEPSIGS